MTRKGHIRGENRSSPDLPASDAIGGAGERLVLRPDGYHWIAHDGRDEFGPFETREAALADMQAADELSLAPEESLEEVEAEIGVNAWIDPETGEPAEGECSPRLPDE